MRSNYRMRFMLKLNQRSYGRSEYEETRDEHLRTQMNTGALKCRSRVMKEKLTGCAGQRRNTEDLWYNQVDAAAFVDAAFKGRGRRRSFRAGASRGRRRSAEGEERKGPPGLFIRKMDKDRRENQGVKKRRVAQLSPRFLG